MKTLTALAAFLLLLTPTIFALDFFSTASVETYRTNLNTTLISPNIYFKIWRIEGYGFYDRYLEEPQFYHGEFMLTFQPLTAKPYDRFSIIAEQRWDKFADDESSIGIKIKLW